MSTTGTTSRPRRESGDPVGRSLPVSVERTRCLGRVSFSPPDPKSRVIPRHPGRVEGVGLDHPEGGESQTETVVRVGQSDEGSVDTGLVTR